MATGIKIRVTVLPPQTPSGGDLSAAYTVHVGLASESVLDALLWWVNFVKDSAERGWPVGPERNRPHSKNTFAVEPVLVSDREGFKIVNSADYLTFIHEPGKRERFVVDREINELVDLLEPTIRADLLDAFIRGFNS